MKLFVLGRWLLRQSFNRIFLFIECFLINLEVKSETYYSRGDFKEVFSVNKNSIFEGYGWVWVWLYLKGASEVETYPKPHPHPQTPDPKFIKKIYMF